MNVALTHFLCFSNQAFVYLNINPSILNKLEICLCLSHLSEVDYMDPALSHL